jgi:hypothetical protein
MKERNNKKNQRLLERFICRSSAACKIGLVVETLFMQVNDEDFKNFSNIEGEKQAK